MISFSLKDKFSKIILVFTLYTIGSLFFGSLFELYFSNLGLNLAQIILSSIGIYFVPILLLPILSKVDSKKFIPIGFATFGLAAAVLLFWNSFYAPFVARTIIGLGIIFFWMPFNTMFYEFSKNNAAFLGSIYYSIGPVLSLVLPAFSGIIAAGYGYSLVFEISSIFFILSAVAIIKITEQKEYKYDLWKAIGTIKGLRTLFFIEGFSINTIIPVTLSAMILLYFNEPIAFGALISGATLFSIAASLITAKFSDKSGERRIYIIASALGFLIAAILTSISTSAEAFFLGFSIIGFFRGILLPLPLAIAVDKSKDIAQTMIAREFFLNIGRVALVGLGYIIIMYFNIRILLIIQTVVAAFYIPIFEIKKKTNIKTS